MTIKFEDDITVDGAVYYVRADVERVEGQKQSAYEPGIAAGWTVDEVRVQLFGEWYDLRVLGDTPHSYTIHVDTKTYQKIVAEIIRGVEK